MNRPRSLHPLLHEMGMHVRVIQSQSGLQTSFEKC